MLKSRIQSSIPSIISFIILQLYLTPFLNFSPMASISVAPLYVSTPNGSSDSLSISCVITFLYFLTIWVPLLIILQLKMFSGNRCAGVTLSDCRLSIKVCYPHVTPPKTTRTISFNFITDNCYHMQSLRKCPYDVYNFVFIVLY